MEARPPSPLPRGRAAWAGAALVLAALAAYSGSFKGPFVFDDLPSIADNASIRGWASALRPPGTGTTVTGRPVLNLSLAMNWAVSGPAVWSYHWANLAIHVCAGLALFGIVRRTLGGAWTGCGEARPSTLRSNGFWLAFSAALFWTLHPLQTEAVTYVVQRAESLMGLFYFLR